MNAAPTTTPEASAAPLDIARGVLMEIKETDEGREIILAIPNSDYRLHLVPTGEITTPVGRAIHGRIDLNARRIDVCGTGGQFIDPVYGRPRTVTGRIRAIIADDNALIVKAKIPLRVHVRAPQKATDFETGTLINFFVDRGATFTPVEPEQNG